MAEQQTHPSGATDDNPMGRPVNADGTTSWEIIFDDPTRGVLPAVRATKSSAQLTTVLENVALLLFKRKRDSGPRQEFFAKLMGIVERHDDDFEAARNAIVSVLEAEREERIEKARAYQRNKMLTQRIERRRERPAAQRATAGLDNTQKKLIGALLVFILIVAAGGYAFFVGFDDDTREASRTEDVKEADPRPAQPPRPAPPAPAERNDDPPPEILMLALGQITFDRNLDGVTRPAGVVPMFDLKRERDEEKACQVVPIIREAIILKLFEAGRQGVNMTDQELARIAQRVRSDLSGKPAIDALGALYLPNVRDVPQSVFGSTRMSGCAAVMVRQRP